MKPNNKKLKVLITGASGFLGKNLKEFLHDRYNLLLPSHKNLDLLDTKAVEKYLKTNKFDVVVHGAAVGISRKNNTPEAFILNMRMFTNLFSFHKYYGKMIFLGSGAEYDKRRDLKNIKEQEFGASVPADPYGLYKYLCSFLIEKSSNIINLRLFAVFGKYEDYQTRFISNTICKSLFGLPVVINQDVKFDYFSVNDLVKVVDYFISHKARHKFYNVGSGRVITLREIVRKIEKLSNKHLPVKVKEKGFNKQYSGSNALLLKEIPGFKFEPFDSSLKALYNWYAKNRKSINKKQLSFD